MKKNTIILVSILFLIFNCSPDSNGDTATSPSIDCTVPGTSSVTVSWDPPHAFELTNVAGGGHKIYYSSQSGVTTSASYVNVPYATSPTSGTISNLLSGCTYYVRVQAYSALNPAGGGLSVESSFTIQ